MEVVRRHEYWSVANGTEVGMLFAILYPFSLPFGINGGLVRAVGAEMQSDCIS